jgi:predicted RNase H-like HicB family nuclease
MIHRYTVVFEKGPKSYGAFVPDLPGCVAVAKTRPAANRLIREAIKLHWDDLRDRGRRVPRPLAVADLVEVAV